MIIVIVAAAAVAANEKGSATAVVALAATAVAASLSWPPRSMLLIYKCLDIYSNRPPQSCRSHHADHHLHDSPCRSDDEYWAMMTRGALAAVWRRGPVHEHLPQSPIANQYHEAEVADAVAAPLLLSLSAVPSLLRP